MTTSREEKEEIICRTKRERETIKTSVKPEGVEIE
jgi:hypothetical protein